MSAPHEEWPMNAAIMFLQDDGTWKHYAEISTVEHAEAWIAKRAAPERWKAAEKSVTASNEGDDV
jgi:hypothetical protein